MGPMKCVSAGLVVVAIASGVRAQGARSFKSGTIQVTADGRSVWVVNREHGSVTRLDASGVRELPLADCNPSAISVSEDGARAWVTCPDQDAVIAVDPDGQQAGRVTFAWGAAPEALALSPDGTHLLVTLRLAGKVAVIDAPSLAVESVVPTWRGPFGVAWERDGAAAWITHASSDGEATRVSRVALSPARLTASVRLGFQQPSVSTRVPADRAEGGAVVLHGHLAMRPGTGELWLPALHLAIRDPVTTPDTTAQSALHVVDAATARFLPERRVVLTAVDAHDPLTGQLLGPGFDAHVSGPVDIGFSARGDVAWVLHETSNDLLEYPLDAGARPGSGGAATLREVAVGGRPMGLAVDPRAHVAWVHAALDREIVAVDLDAFEVVARIRTSALPAPSLRGEALDGAKLFFRSDLREISSNEKVACSTCHPGGGTDGLVWPEQFLAAPLGPRATTSLLGLSLAFGPRDPVTGFGQLHRSGDRDEVQDFDFTYRGEQMGGTGFIAPGTSGGYGGPPNDGESPQMDAIAAFLLGLDPLPHSPRRADGGGLTEAARRGAAIFSGTGGAPADAGCIDCHQPGHGFADLRFHDVSSPRTSDEHEINARNPAWFVNTPSLVGLFATAPWDRGGAAGTQRESLVDLVGDMAAAGGHGDLAALGQGQLRDLTEFLASIDGRTGLADAQAIDADPPRLVRVEPLSRTRVVAWFSETVDGASATSRFNWSITTNGQDVPIDGVEWDAVHGDRVTLHVQLPRSCSGQAYVVQPGPIQDAAAQVSGRVANVLDVSDLANRRVFALGDPLTVTLGSSGAEDLVVPVHDAGMAGPDDPARFLDSPWMRSVGGGATIGLVRFEWLDAFTQATGVTDPAALVDVSVSLQPSFGSAGAVEARRVLKPWADAHSGDVADAPPGAPSWLSCAAPLAWSVPGAGARGGTGGDPADYLGAFDVAAAVDATSQLASLDGRFELGGAGILDAYRFWMRNPLLDHGHALVATGGSELRLERSEDSFGDFAPVLRITYALPPTQAPAPEVSAPASGSPLLVARVGGGVALAFEDAGAASYHAVTGLLDDCATPLAARCLAVTAGAGGRLGSSLPVPDPAAWFVVAADGPCGGDPGTDSRGTSRVAWTAPCTP